jgi:hypothetical protein
MIGRGHLAGRMDPELCRACTCTLPAPLPRPRRALSAIAPLSHASSATLSLSLSLCGVGERLSMTAQPPRHERASV